MAPDTHARNALGQTTPTPTATPAERGGAGGSGGTRRVSVGTLLITCLVAAIIASVVTASVFTARSREDALEKEIDALTVQLASAAQTLEDCQGSRQAITDAVTEIAAARDDMDSALGAYDAGASIDVTRQAIIAANARYAGALEVIEGIPGCG